MRCSYTAVVRWFISCCLSRYMSKQQRWHHDILWEHKSTTQGPLAGNLPFSLCRGYASIVLRLSACSVYVCKLGWRLHIMWFCYLQVLSEFASVFWIWKTCDLLRPPGWKLTTCAHENCKICQFGDWNTAYYFLSLSLSLNIIHFNNSDKTSLKKRIMRM